MKEYIILGKDSVGYYEVSTPIFGELVQDSNGTRITSENPFDILAVIPAECIVIETKYTHKYKNNLADKIVNINEKSVIKPPLHIHTYTDPDFDSPPIGGLHDL